MGSEMCIRDRGYLGPGDSKIQAINLAIKARENNVKELEAQEGSLLGPKPEQVIQRFIVSLKQVIGHMRLEIERLLKERDRLLGSETKKERKAGEDLLGSLLKGGDLPGGVLNIDDNLPASILIKLFNGRNTEQVESMLATTGYETTTPLENNRLKARKRWQSGSYQDLTLVFKEGLVSDVDVSDGVAP